MIEHGVCDLAPGLDVEVFIDSRHLMAFGGNGQALAAMRLDDIRRAG